MGSPITVQRQDKWQKYAELLQPIPSAANQRRRADDTDMSKTVWCLNLDTSHPGLTIALTGLYGDLCKMMINLMPVIPAMSKIKAQLRALDYYYAPGRTLRRSDRMVNGGALVPSVRALACCGAPQELTMVTR